ncbi:MAG: malto-oligosyltrehalose synthase [Mycobacteriales bacterium]
MVHLPADGKPVPVSTYRLQLRPRSEEHPGFGFDDAAAATPYLALLGVTHLYCSPYLQAAPGSSHGYDVVDHSRLNVELGGDEAFARMVAACRDAGLGIILDVVPNHMAVSEPESQNAQWWSVLREGRQSPYADWFDIDWTTGKVLVPILGAPLEDVLDELTMDDDSIRYYGHVLPIAVGTLVPGDVAATLERQHYRLCHWQLGGTELNYRRFFDVTTLAGVRVEVPSVFDETHHIVVQQIRTGVLDGLRIDHPDGLADPGGYLARLSEQTDGAWVVVEKILEPGEQLPGNWDCAGTTGYDALNRVLGLFVDPAGEPVLTAHWRATTGATSPYHEVVARTKRLILSDVLAAEVNRLSSVAVRAVGDGVEPVALREGLVELLASFGVYRAYVPPAGPAAQVAREHMSQAVEAAVAANRNRKHEIEVLAKLALADGPRGDAAEEFVTRFQQTCGPVMAKGVEDTAFYRFLRLSALNEVGGDPSCFGTSVQSFHDGCAEASAQWPTSMTTLSTHDTKRSEDVRARLVLLSQSPESWAAAATRWSGMARRYGSPDAPTEQLIWQTVFGAWPLSADRLVGYLEKATREAKDRTSWLAPVPAFDRAVARFARDVLADHAIVADITGFVAAMAPAWRVTALAQKLVQLTMPGVADTYQGTELFDLSLVDPDNRRPVDYDERRRLLAASSAAAPVVDDSGAAKLHVVSRALRLRRRHPEWFLTAKTYTPIEAGLRSLAFARSDQVVTVVPTRAVRTCADGWGDETVELPAGDWHNELTGAAVTSGRLGVLLADFPIALLTRQQQPF